MSLTIKEKHKLAGLRVWTRFRNGIIVDHGVATPGTEIKGGQSTWLLVMSFDHNGWYRTDLHFGKASELRLTMSKRDLFVMNDPQQDTITHMMSLDHLQSIAQQPPA